MNGTDQRRRGEYLSGQLRGCCASWVVVNAFVKWIIPRILTERLRDGLNQKCNRGNAQKRDAGKGKLALRRPHCGGELPRESCPLMTGNFPANRHPYQSRKANNRVTRWGDGGPEFQRIAAVDEERLLPGHPPRVTAAENENASCVLANGIARGSGRARILPRRPIP